MVLDEALISASPTMSIANNNQEQKKDDYHYDDFNSAKRRFERTLFDFRNACDDLVRDMREDDDEGVTWAKDMLDVAITVSNSALDQLNAVEKKVSLMENVAAICGRAADSDSNDSDDNDDNAGATFDDDVKLVPTEERHAVIELARQTRYVFSDDISAETVGSTDEFATRVFEIGGAQFIFHCCYNEFVNLLRDAYFVARPAGLPFITSSWIRADGIDIFAPFEFSQIDGVGDFDAWPETLAVWGEEFQHCYLAPVSLDSVDLGSLRALINLPHLTDDIGDRSLRLLLAVASMLPEFCRAPDGVFSEVNDMDPNSTVPSDFKTIGYATPTEQTVQLTKLVDWFHPHDDMVDFLMALSPLRLPALVELEILDWLPGWRRTSRYAKCKVIDGVRKSILALRSEHA